MNQLQAMVDGMNAQWQKERATSQMTLGKLIAMLESMPADKEIFGLSNPHSYRGYYCDLAFERQAGEVKAGDLLTECRAAMGKVFEGYKGGDFIMGESTPVWVAQYGDCGKRLMALNPDGTIETAEDE